MLVNMDRLLRVATENGFAVPAFNISDYAMLNGIMATCEAERAPLIIAIHPDELRHIGTELVLAMIEKAHRASIPVCIHLDHGTSFDQVVKAIRCGFTSVMIDGSRMSFAQNVQICQKVVELAHLAGVTVEGELGTIGQVDAQGESGANQIIYTNPDDAVTFVRETGVDCLAVAIGTSHGLYPKGKKPKLALDLLKTIRERVSVPLVLHGGSGNTDEEVEKAVELGISKVNISSDTKAVYYQKMRQVLQDTALREPNVIEPPCVEAMNQVVVQKIRLFKANAKADLY